jgi:hypothetical protein
MQTKLLIAVLAICTVTAKAQFGTKGQSLIGGQFNVSQLNASNPFGDEVKRTTANVTVSLAKFRREHVLSGFFITAGRDVTSSRPSLGNNPDPRSHQLGAGYSKTWFKPIGKKFFFGIGGSAGINYTYTSIIENTPISNRVSAQGYSIRLALAPSLSYQLSNRFVANISPNSDFLNVGYTHIINKSGGTTTSKINTFALNSGLSGSVLENISIGFSYLLKRKP